MGPHADFACLSRKCQQDGAASVYDLPVNATRCPVCGSKRLQRLYNAMPGVLKSDSITRQHIVDQAGSEMQAKQTEMRDANIRQQKANAPMFGVPIKQLGAALQRIAPWSTVNGTVLNTSEHARPSPVTPLPVFSDLRRAGVKPEIQARDSRKIDKEGKITE